VTFSPYSALKARIAAETMRTDAAFIAEIPGWVRLAEQRMWYGEADGQQVQSRVRCRGMDTSAALSFTDGAATVPALMLEASGLVWGPAEPSLVDRATFWVDKTGWTVPTHPSMYTVEGDVIRVWPALTGTARIMYVQKLDGLAAEDSTNWILTNAPAVYFHGVLMEAWRFLRDDAQQAKATEAYRRAVVALNRTELDARVSPTAMRRQPRLVIG
jgi:hypothetical protein